MSLKRHRQTIAALALKYGRYEDVLLDHFPKRARRLGLSPEAARPRSKRERLYALSQQCHWCQRPLQYHEATVEHLHRRIDGGSNSMSNLAIACGPCNWSRGTETDPVKVAELGERWRIAHALKQESIYRAHPKPTYTHCPPEKWDECAAAFLYAIEQLA